MARITVEDCLEVVNNRFELVMMASKRARQLANGVQATLDNSESDDKPTVLALREIAARKIDNALIDVSSQPRAACDGAGDPARWRCTTVAPLGRSSTTRRR